MDSVFYADSKYESSFGPNRNLFTEICQILLKKTQNDAPIMVRSGVSQVAMFFWVLKIDIFVALEKIYRMR